ncbi:MAG: selenocysteine-specific translation elongation factor [Desulfobulbaceae bacterium]|jgi:selenocysteine-specific elongation factor|nr:selenocysteine-specific translation elongation factor [Desulfobulbaceae bacterium]
MREIVLGTAGHVDHGKTSLVRALTGIETDRLQEEKRRGITIELGFAFLDLPCGHRLGIVDVPGHEKFVKNMVAGVTGMDLLAFVIAADEGIMPQTREHFEICRLLGVKNGLVVITKKDMVEPDWLEMVIEEVRVFCQGSFLESAPILTVSSVTGEGIEELRQTLDSMVRGQNFSEAFGPFRLPVDRVFAMKGFGAVVTGTSISGRLTLAEDVQLFPGDKTAKVRGIQVHGQSVGQVEAGHRTAINLQGAETGELRRGMVLAPPASLQSSFMLDCRLLYLAANVKALAHRTRVRVHIGTAEILGRVSLLDRDQLEPGAEAGAQLLLEEPVAVWPGDRFVIRGYSPVFTIGGGEVLGNLPPRKRKRLGKTDRAYNREMIEILGGGVVEDILLFHLREHGALGLTAEQLAPRLGLFGKQLKKVLEPPISTKKIVVVDSQSQRYLHAEVAAALMAELEQRLGDWHAAWPLLPGMAKEELRQAFGARVDGRVFQYCLQTLVNKGVVAQEEAIVRLAGHEVRLTVDESQLRHDMRAWYRDKGLFTPTLRETQEQFTAYPEKRLREVLELLLRDGELVKISENLFYDKDVLAGLTERVVAHIREHGEIDAPAFKELSGLTRKFSIPILEYFDRVKLTIRLGDKRVLRKA